MDSSSNGTAKVEHLQDAQGQTRLHSQVHANHTKPTSYR
jgi:hypothetical protein